MSTNDLKSRLNKISTSAPAREVKKQTTVIRQPAKSQKPGPKNTWKDTKANYVRLYTQLQEADRNLLKSQIAGGSLNGTFESVDHFINEAIIRLLNEYNIETSQNSTVV